MLPWIHQCFGDPPFCRDISCCFSWWHLWRVKILHLGAVFDHSRATVRWLTCEGSLTGFCEWLKCWICLHFTRCLLVVTRSRKIESDRGYQKNEEGVWELKVLWKKEKLHSTINKCIVTFDINTITSFYFKNIHFKNVNTSHRFCVDHHFLYILSSSYHELGSFRDGNLFLEQTCSVISNSFISFFKHPFIPTRTVHFYDAAIDFLSTFFLFLQHVFILKYSEILLMFFII